MLMKVILTSKKEIENLKQISNLLSLVLFNYKINVIEKNKENKRKTIKEVKTVIAKMEEPKKKIIDKKFIEKDLEDYKRKKEWMEYYYSQSKERDEIDKTISYYSEKKRMLDYY